MSDEPLTPDERVAPFAAEVIDLADVRIRWGRTKPSDRIRPCDHNNLTYNDTERRVWCEDCERTLDGFDAFRSLVESFSKMERAARDKLKKANDALAKTIRRRAAQELSRVWSGRMLPCCPHCRRGLMAHDFADGASASVSKEFEQAARKRGDAA